MLFFYLTRLDAQQSFLLDNFVLVNSNESIELRWRLTAGNTCDGITIYRSTDSLNFEKIGAIYGVCGSTFENQSFSYIDENPIYNKINYYRLQFGGFALTETRAIKVIDFRNVNYYIEPHPVISSSRLYFSNDFNLSANLTIFDLNGAEVYTLRTSSDFFELSNCNFNHGIYFFRIIIESTEIDIKGKFLK